MKKIMAFILIFAFAFMVAGCHSQEKAKKEIFNLVEENYDAILKACEEKDADALSAIDGITQVRLVDGYIYWSIARARGLPHLRKTMDSITPKKTAPLP